MVNTLIPFALIAISASFVLAKVPEVVSRETSKDDLLARDSDAVLEERNYPKTIFSREDSVDLQEREPFAFLLGRLAMRAGARAVKHHVGNRANNRRRRDLEAEDELDLASRGDMDEELDMIEREMSDEDVLEREVDEDLYLD